MSLSKEIMYMTTIFQCMTETTSLTDKQIAMDLMLQNYPKDTMYVLGVLSGKYKFGYKYNCDLMLENIAFDDNSTVGHLLDWLRQPLIQNDLSQFNIDVHVGATYRWREFLEPIVNRTLKLGLGNSVLEKWDKSPMLAKKYYGTLPSSDFYYVTEKLDGNRCVAYYDECEDCWKFISRSGKPLHVSFNMGELPTCYIYDGEILSPEQVKKSDIIKKVISSNIPIEELTKMINTDCSFNKTSGLINQKSTDKKLVYNIFDLQLDEAYSERRRKLNGLMLTIKGGDVRVLPVLRTYGDIDELYDTLPELLHKVTLLGGEGLMINLSDAHYIHKRTDALLKFKEVQSMDMQVTDVLPGQGKYKNLVGALVATCITDDGKTITCKVGSGLSDEERRKWIEHPNLILGKIIEVEYFSLSQDALSANSSLYSLRFPRLKCVREDKKTTSEY